MHTTTNKDEKRDNIKLMVDLRYISTLENYMNVENIINLDNMEEINVSSQKIVIETLSQPSTNTI